MEGMKRIVCSGTHGVGKTTFLYALAAAYKKLQANVTIVNEIVRQCPFPINEGAAIETEFWIVHSQVKAELEAKAQGYEICLCDRGAWDGIVYWSERNLPNKYFEHLEQAALQWTADYDVIILVEPDDEVTQFAIDAVRASSIEYRNKIRDQFRMYVEKLPPETKEKMIILNSNDVFAELECTSSTNKIISALSGSGQLNPV